VAPTAVAVIIGLLAIEGTAWGLSRLNLLPVSDTPKAWLPMQARQELETEWRTERDAWGAWHRPNTKGLGIKPCFRVEYLTNSVGARDDEFAEQSAEARILLLGDSFAEGYAVSQQRSVAGVLERQLARSVLNFGAGGDLGPLQYWLLYENLARRFAHQTLIVFVLPDNDFTDNDYAFWQRIGSNLIGDGTDAERWRPYFRAREDGSFGVMYPQRARQRDAWTTHTADAFRVKRWVYEHLWSYNVLRSIKLILLSRRIEAARSGKEYSGYFDATPQQQQAAVYFLKQLLGSSAAAEILVVAIPRAGDMQRIRSGDDPAQQPWRLALQSIGSGLPGKRYSFLDLADHAPASVSEFFNQCDGHWTEQGNAWAAGIIAEHMTGPPTASDGRGSAESPGRLPPD
jgi:hypothetical protein